MQHVWNVTALGTSAPARWVGRSLRSLTSRPTCPVCPDRVPTDLFRVEIEEHAGLGCSAVRDWRCRRCGAIVRLID